MSTKKLLIEETPNVIDDHLLDIIGNEFKFDHVKGMAEWLKNSVDAYIGKGVPSNEQYIVFRYIDSDQKQIILECIDFVGMDESSITNALMRWGDPNASKKGKDIKTYGGHGNGGKFYMRQMFQESQFITFKNGLLNIFGFNKEKKYGFARGYKDKIFSPTEALKFAEIDNLSVPEKVLKDILNGKSGFTVVRGLKPLQLRSRFKVSKEIERLKNHPQSRRILFQSNVSVIYNNKSLYSLLKPDTFAPLEKFETPRTTRIPDISETLLGKSKQVIKLTGTGFEQGYLTLKTTLEPLTRESRLGELNRIDILGEIGTLASYQLYEIGVQSWPYAAFIYGECHLPILEDPNHDCVTNDRTKLVKNELTEALLKWIASEVDKLALEIGDLDREKHKLSQREVTSKFNDVLNEWKNKHMHKIISDLFSSSGNTDNGDMGRDGIIGSKVTLPPNGFDFKWPKVIAPVNAPSTATLKVSVPDCLPLGTEIVITSNSDVFSVEEKKLYIKSDHLKSVASGKEVAFIDITVVGLIPGKQAILRASAGKLEAETEISVVEEKKGKGGKAFPRVLLSSIDPDPLNLSQSGILHLSEREAVVYQRPQDAKENIYWINTSSPMASMIYDRFTFESIQWRNFLFERYVDIFIKEAIHELEKKDYENFNADSVDAKISEVVKKIHESAKEDLDNFLFNERYSTTHP